MIITPAIRSSFDLTKNDNNNNKDDKHNKDEDNGISCLFGLSADPNLNMPEQQPSQQSSQKALKRKQEQEQYYYVLVEFFYKHLDFHMAELQSVLELYDIQLGSSQCQIVPLPNSSSSSSNRSSNSNNNSEGGDYAKQTKPTGVRARRPFVILAFPMDDAVRLSTPSPSSSRQQQQQGQNQNGSRPTESKSTSFEFDPYIDVPARSSMSKLSPSSEKAISSQAAASATVTGDLPWIAEILSKCTLVKSVIELWSSSATSLEDCVQKAHDFLNDENTDEDGVNNSNKRNKHDHSCFHRNLHHIMYGRKPKASTTTTDDDNTCADNDDEEKRRLAFRSWKMTIHTLGQKFHRDYQNAMRKAFSPILDGIPGPVRLDSPDMEFLLIREIELDHKGSPLCHGAVGDVSSGDDDPSVVQPLAFYFGRVLGGGKVTRNIHNRFTLKKRPYLGPTSMDAELSFVMTSLGQIHKGSVVFDPFVGTGSILLSCALRGAYCVGSDIDIRVLRGKGGDQTIWKNFESYGLPRPEIIRSDNALYHRHYQHHHGNKNNNNQNCLYDAILTDPPYGIRAGAKQSGSKLENPRPVLEENRHDHIAQTKAYPVSDVMADLLDVAARTLVMGGRLVYIIPSFRDFNPDTDLPRHECLESIHSCYQPFSPELGRRIVVMKKTSSYDPSQRPNYMENVWLNGIESAEKCINIRNKLIEAAKEKPGYEERAEIRKQKRRDNKEAKKLAKKQKKDEESKKTEG